MSDLPSQYSEDMETFRQFLILPDPMDSIPRSSTTVWALNDVADQQELKPRGPSAMLRLSPQLKEVFDKIKQDFRVANLPEYIKPCFENKIQLNTDFAKICISPNGQSPPTGSRRV